MSLQATVIAFALVFAGVVYLGAALFSWRRVSAPASTQFGAAVGFAGLGSIALAVSVLDSPVNTLSTAVIVAFILPVPWLIFAFEYTGRTELRAPLTIVTIASPIALGLLSTLLVFLARLVPALDAQLQGGASGFFAVLIFVLTIAEGITLLYTGGMMLIGTGMLLRVFHQYEHLDADSGVLVGVFGSVPWLSLLFGFQVSTTAYLALPASIATGFIIGAGAIGLTTIRGQLFERLPAAGNIGPATVFRELEDIVLVTDASGTVIELNAAAERKLTEIHPQVFGVDVVELLGSTPTDLGERESVQLRLADGRRLFDPTVSELTDQHGRLLGYAIVLYDVTERTIREQRLEVLNRVLRHNLRNDSMIVTGYAGLIADSTDDPDIARNAATITETGEGLASLSETARSIDRLLAGDHPSTEVSLTALVADAIEEAPDGVTYRQEVPEDIVLDVPRSLPVMAISALLENAVVHNDSDTPHVSVRAQYDPDADYPVEVSVADDGPGMPTMEREVIIKGLETPLYHGSGLGLWLVRWVVTLLGGTLEIRENEPRGTVVSIFLPSGRLVAEELAELEPSPA